MSGEWEMGATGMLSLDYTACQSGWGAILGDGRPVFEADCQRLCPVRPSMWPRSGHFFSLTAVQFNGVQDADPIFSKKRVQETMTSGYLEMLGTLSRQKEGIEYVRKFLIGLY